ncbi:hypothetical protein A2335_03625 [Candidatus Peregrinibacteria bacterium RIFOXYB2_FULL_32_7]|nr:MAG: hypothetical protein A2335_03625 [Candidatus Peregrinibacteria bacterium RIFOXYB2_FULL_32_7]
MQTIVLKVDDKIPQEIDIIKEAEGLGNKTATFIFLIKYYFLTKNKSLDNSIEIFNKLLDRIDINSLPSAEEQLVDV